jgi:Family of unknown function (DUF5309)
MAFSGLSSNKLFTPNLVGEDISNIMRTLSPYEAPFLDWLGDADAFAGSTKHEFVQDFLRPRYIINSTAISSATAATAFQVNGLGEALTVGTILENESAAPELMQVNSIIGPNSINVTRNYDNAVVGSLAPGGQIYVRWPAAEEGHDHSGAHTARLGARVANTVGYFNIEIAATGTQVAINQYGGDTYENARAKIFKEIPGLLESEVVRGVWNGTNSLGTTTASRTMKGLRGFITDINSTITATSFAANPHLYLGNIWEQTFQAGASTDETWGIVAGRTFFRDISNMNDTKVQDSNEKEKFKRVVREYQGPFGLATVFLSRSLPPTELLLVPRERVKVVALQGRNFSYQEMGKTGDNQKGMVVGEYTVEPHHPSAMARLRV